MEFKSVVVPNLILAFQDLFDENREKSREVCNSCPVFREKDNFRVEVYNIPRLFDRKPEFR